MEQDYSKREVDEKFGDIQASLTRIEIQTVKTNGRVTELEKWKYIVIGSTGVLTAVVVPILTWALWVLVNINTEVHRAVDDALSAYSIER